MPEGFAQLSLYPQEKTSKSLGHDYQEVRSIGRGSFGQASLAKDKNGNLCVVKQVDISELDQEKKMDAVNEVKVLSVLKHPYIVRYHKSFIENGTLSIVMDYADGGDLGKQILNHREKQQLFTEGQIMHWFTQALLGLKYLHTKQILHRDLKPQNIFLTRQGDLRLGDFGISKVLQGRSSNKEETTIGTPYYFSPEICNERVYSFASDIWALGCILYELAALHVPFEAQNILGLISKITEGRPEPLPEVFSTDLRILCRELLHRDHSRRPSAEVIAQKPMIQSQMRKMLEDVPKSDSSSSPPLNRCGSASGLFKPPATPARRAPSAPGLSPAGSNVLRQSASCLLTSSTGATKAPWPEMRPTLLKGFPPACNGVDNLTVKPLCGGASPNRRMGTTRCGANRGRTRRGGSPVKRMGGVTGTSFHMQ